MVSTYIPLYRKYRPERFANLVGQEALVKTLTNAIDLNRVAHAYLFSGPRGTGKTSSARIFARSLNCQNGPTATPCGTCNHCQDMANGTSMDVIEIDAASNNSVEHARNLLEKVQFVPVSGKYKIYIIDEVHMLSTAAFNTLLKTLEEPPANLVFILATTEPHKVLETIISRCQRFDFRRIKQQDIFNRLKEIAKIESIDITDSALSLIARKSSGGLRDALALLDQAGVLANANEQVTDKEIMTLLGTLSEDILYKIVDTLAHKNAQNLIPIVNELVQSGNEPLQIIRELMSYFRNLMLIKTTSDKTQLVSIVDASEQFFDFLKSQSEKFEVIETAQIIEKLSDSERTLKTTTNQYLWLEVALVSICYREDIHVIKDLQERLSNLESAIGEGSVQKTIKSVQSANISMTKPVLNKPEPKIEVSQQIIKEESKQDIKEEIKAEVQEYIAKPVVKEETKFVEPQVEEPKKQPERDESVSDETLGPAPSNDGSFSGDLGRDWTLLLENISSIPSRMFFKSLARPVEISNDKIVITFVNEAFVKQAQDKSKHVPLEKAAQNILGATPHIIVRTPLLDDQKKNSIVDSSQPARSEPKVSQKQNILPSDPSTNPIQNESDIKNFNEQKTKIIAKPTVKVKPEDNEDVDIKELAVDVAAKLQPINLSDQAKTVLDLFQGKVIEK